MLDKASPDGKLLENKFQNDFCTGNDHNWTITLERESLT